MPYFSICEATTTTKRRNKKPKTKFNEVSHARFVKSQIKKILYVFGLYFARARKFFVCVLTETFVVLLPLFSMLLCTRRYKRDAFSIIPREMILMWFCLAAIRRRLWRDKIIGNKIVSSHLKTHRQKREKVREKETGVCDLNAKPKQFKITCAQECDQAAKCASEL